ncbi:hypothetical protein [Kitasatospora sp. NPDC090091]|uniref:hypothetical protein n=1 Tax=Kitasatospora sp. NPDC090091 TaxID=3364081 RepID=UPI003815E9ED
MKRSHPALALPAAALLLGALLSGCASSDASLGAGTPETAASPHSDAAPAHAGVQDLESALGEQGRGDFKDTFGTLQLDAPGGRVLLFATDETRAKALVAAAAAAHPGIDTDRAVIRHASYARVVVDPVIDRITAAETANAFPVPVYTASLAADASGIRITTTKAGLASQALKDAVAKLAGGVPVVYEEGQPIRNMDATAEVLSPPPPR